MKEKFINLNFQNLILQSFENKINIQDKIIILLGKSGSGKSFLLEYLALKYKFIFFKEPFFNEESFLQSLCKLFFKDTYKLDFNEFCEKVKQNKIKATIALDEVGMYEEELLEKIRILSDTSSLKFILSLHKKQKLFFKEHFKSRIAKEFHLKGLNLEDLKTYSQNKYELEFKKNELKWLLRLAKNNLRIINQILSSFKELYSFYTQNNQKHSFKKLLELSALHHDFIG